MVECGTYISTVELGQGLSCENAQPMTDGVYNATSYLIGWARSHNDACSVIAHMVIDSVPNRRQVIV